LIIKREYFHRW